MIEGVDRGGGRGYGDKRGGIGVGGAESGLEGAEVGGEGAGIEGAGSLERLGREIDFFPYTCIALRSYTVKSNFSSL